MGIWGLVFWGDHILLLNESLEGCDPCVEASLLGLRPVHKMNHPLLAAASRRALQVQLLGQQSQRPDVHCCKTITSWCCIFLQLCTCGDAHTKINGHEVDEG